MKKIVLGVFVALCLITLARSQAFAGGAIPHFYTGITIAELPNNLLENNPYTYSLDRAAFSAGEEVTIGTAIRDYGWIVTSGPLPTAASAYIYYIHIEVSNATLTPNKKALQFYLNLTQSQSNVLNFPERVKHVTLSFIIVGELFQGHYDASGLPSMYVFARNSLMVTPVGTGNTLFDFKNINNEQSPFSYDSTNTTYYGGCGAVKKDGNWIFEYANCTKITGTLFITGFDFTTEGGNVNTINLGTTVTDLQKNLKDTTAGAIYTPDTTRDGILVKVTNPSTGNLNKLQLMVVMIGIVEYTQGVYPVQGTLFANNFDANSYIDITPAQTLSSTTISNPDTGAAPYYNNFDPTKFGHRICGLNGFSFTDSYTEGTDVNKFLGFVLTSPEPNPSLVDQKIAFAKKPTTNNQLTTLTTGYSCLLFTSDSPCTESSRQISVLSPSSTITPTTAATVTYTGTLPAAPYSVSGDLNLLANVPAFAQQTFSAAGTIVYSATVAPADVKVGTYEGVLYFSSDTAPTTAVQETVKIEIFGNVVALKTFDVSSTKYMYYIHFGFSNNNPTNNTIFITFTSNGAITPTQLLQFGLYAQDNVIGSNQTCVTSCASVAGFTTGVDYTSSPPTCINCDSTLNLVFDPASGACVCAPGYYLGSTGCVACTVTLCGQCTTDITGCTACVPNAYFVSTTDPKQGCACNTGFYRSGSQCLACAPGCATCTNGVECATCVANSDTRLNTTYNCICKNGTYDAGTPICPTCAPECLTCSVSAINCTSCNTTGFFDLTGTTCQCQNGYYLATVNSAPQCFKCHYSCANCSGDAAICLSCKSAEWTKVGNQCVCNKVLKFVYYANLTVEGFCVDQKCTTIDPQCVECNIIALTGQNVCKRCNEAANWTLASNNISCICRSGFFLNADGECSACGAGCQTCTSAAACSNCAFGAVRTGPGTCVCPPGTYLSSAFGPLQCLSCDPNCAECQIASNICTRCINGFSTINNACVCPPNRFSSDGINCVSCGVGCSRCTSATTCGSCVTGYIPSNGICMLSCPAGTYNGGDQCFQCSSDCRNCNSDLDCRSCNTGFYLFLGGCVSSCPSGFLPYANTLCIACGADCATCSGTPNNCLTCANNKVLSGNQCLTACPTGQFFNGVQCAACTAPCAACEISATQCTACNQGLYLFRNQCTTACPTIVVNGICQNICSDGFFTSGTLCQRCSSNCNTCSSLNVCTSCKNNLLLFRGNCVMSCPVNSNTLVSSGSCIDCDVNCLGCSGSSTSCINCVAGTYRLAERCYATCPIGYYTDLATISCKRCDANCRTCTGPGLCSACLDNSAPTGGLCAINCGANCIECQGSTCTRCAPSFFWNGQSCQSYCPSGATQSNGVCVCPTGQFLNLGACVTSCPPEFVNVNSQCLSCQTPCRTCSTNPTSCDSCIDGFSLDPVSRRCTRAAACGFGQYASNFADCKFICPESTYYLDSACYVGRCPIGYTPDASRRICQKSTLPSGCNSPLFLQGANCVSNCDAGFYADTTTRVCLPCSSNCAACTGPTVCTSCASGTTLSNNICVIQSDACPPGQFRYNNICVTSCPSGTANRDGFCVRLCAAGLYFWNLGCYETCPTGLSTAESCTLVCGVGFRREGNLCVPTSTQSCGSGQYFNTAIGVCDNCRYPCATCSGSASFCTACPNTFNLVNGVCYSGNACQAGFYASPSGCQRCAVKCATCSNFNVCDTCANGYTNTGADCIQSTTTLTPVTLNVLAVVKNLEGNIAFVQIQPNILPNNVPTNLASQILLFVPTTSASNPATQVNIWIDNGMIFVALTHNGPIPTYRAALILNSNVFDSMYRSMGYSTANVFVEVPISSNVPPVNYSIPPTAANSRVFSQKSIAAVINARLNSKTNSVLERIQLG